MSPPAAPAEDHGRSFWIGLAVGGLVMLWGARLYLDATPDLTRRVSFLRWMVGLDLAHDLLLAPAVLAIGLLVARVVPGRARAFVQAGLIASGFVVLVGLLPLLGSADGDNPTIQPLAYGPSVLLVLAVIWFAVGIAVLAPSLRRRLRGR